MKAQSRYRVYFVMLILALATLGVESSFCAEDIPMAKVSSLAHKYTYSADSAARKARKELDLESLEQRVRESSALGFFDKIKIKYEVDELIQSGSNFHHGISNESVKVLRARYERILSNAFEVLQKDTELCQELSSGREALWKMLLDPECFDER